MLFHVCYYSSNLTSLRSVCSAFNSKIMNEKQLEFKDGNPGAVQYGNFINYYQFHPPENRISLLPHNIWHPQETTDSKQFLALDIGCNAGNLTWALYEFLKEKLPSSTSIKVLAVDIDPALIERAKEQYQINNIQFKCVDCLTNDFDSLIHKFLKESITNNANDTPKLDAVFCFSTTMWIHLNCGDNGLKSFLNKLSTLTRLLVIEPQPWKCYRSAVKRMKGKIDFPYFKQLTLRNNVSSDIVNYLTLELSMRIVYESPETEWQRKITCLINE